MGQIRKQKMCVNKHHLANQEKNIYSRAEKEKVPKSSAPNHSHAPAVPEGNEEGNRSLTYFYTQAGSTLTAGWTLKEFLSFNYTSFIQLSHL